MFFPVLWKTPLPTKRSWRYSSRSFIVLPFTFRFLIYFDARAFKISAEPGLSLPPNPSPSLLGNSSLQSHQLHCLFSLVSALLPSPGINKSSELPVVFSPSAGSNLYHVSGSKRGPLPPLHVCFFLHLVWDKHIYSYNSEGPQTVTRNLWEASSPDSSYSSLKPPHCLGLPSFFSDLFIDLKMEELIPSQDGKKVLLPTTCDWQQLPKWC